MKGWGSLKNSVSLIILKERVFYPVLLINII